MGRRLVFGSLAPIEILNELEILDEERAAMHPDHEGHEADADDFEYIWSPPNYDGDHRVDVYGSLSGGYGAIVRDYNGKPVIAVSDYAKSSPKSLLVVQLEAVQKGLKLALDCGYPTVDVCTESEFLTYIIWGVTSIYPQDCDAKEVDDLLKEIKELESRFDFCAITTTYMPINKAARYLSQLHKTDKFTDVFPEELLKIVEKDLASRAGYEYNLPKETVIDVEPIMLAHNIKIGPPGSLLAQLVAVKCILEAAIGHGCQKVRVLTDSSYTASVIWRKTTFKTHEGEESLWRAMRETVEAIESLEKNFDEGCYIHSRCSCGQNEAPNWYEAPDWYDRDLVSIVDKFRHEMQNLL